MQVRSVAVAASFAAVLAACGPQNGPRVFGMVTNADANRLGTMVAERVGTAEMGSVSVPRVYRWSPVDGRELWIWVACRGGGASRACLVAVGTPGGQRVMAVEPSGWSIATLSDGADRTQILAMGNDGRGTWRQMIMYDRDHDDVTFSRKWYADAM
jgi:hypothetical protein